MNSRERVISTLKFSRPDRPPRDLWALPGVKMFRGADLKEITGKYPLDFACPVFKYGKTRLSSGTPYLKGSYTDEWGCEWFCGEDGVTGEVKRHPVNTLQDIGGIRPPSEMLDNADLSTVNESCAKSGKFMTAGTTVRLFERMQFIMGTESLFRELAYGEPEVLRLARMIHEFYLREIEMWCRTDVDGLSFMDDWGSQNSLLISPRMWREIFKPFYAEYCRMIHASGKYAFFHSDGNIISIIPDLIETGIDALNSQLFCMDFRELGEKFRGKITFWGEIDRQKILPFGTEDDVRNAVRKVKEHLYLPEGGVIAMCEMGLKDPKENIQTVYQTWNELTETP